MSRRAWIALSLAVDAAAVNLAILAAFLVRFGWPLPAFNVEAYQRVLIPLTIGQLLIFLLVDLYDPAAERSGPQLLGTVAKGAFLGIVALVALSFLLRAFSFPRTVIAATFFSLVLFVWGWRRAAASLLKVRWPERRVVVVGDGPDVRLVLDRLATVERWGYRVAAVVSERDDGDGREGDRDPTARKAAGDLESDLADILERERPHQLIVATPSRHRSVLERVAVASSFRGEILVAPELYEMHLGEIDFALLDDLPLLRLSTGDPPAWQGVVKAVSERTAAFALLVLLSPFMILVAAGVLVSSGRPVLYRQTRAGLGQRPFTLLKFRTMVADAEADGPVLASADDPRVTWFGRFLRLSRIDEWPQFWNVLRGEMSLVGPRPERPEFVREFIAADPLYAERFRVRPGITGLAQVSGGYGTEANVKMRFDLMYIYHRSLALDVRILLKTVKVVLVGRGAL